MDCRGGDVKGVEESLARKRPSIQKMPGQVPDVSRDCQYSDIGECRQPTLSSRRIAAARLSEDCLGNVELVSFSVRPPYLGDLLVSRYDDISTGKRRQIADDASFDIDLGWHPKGLSATAQKELLGQATMEVPIAAVIACPPLA